jgi:IclR family mhp operon transcriptional activator
MSNTRDTEYKTVPGLTRGLQILNALNREDGGASPTSLAELTGLHRTTVRRLLETLQDEGYVRRGESDDSFRLSMKVRELSEGFRDEQWIS